MMSSEFEDLVAAVRDMRRVHGDLALQGNVARLGQVMAMASSELEKAQQGGGTEDFASLRHLHEQATIPMTHGNALAAAALADVALGPASTVGNDVINIHESTQTKRRSLIEDLTCDPILITSHISRFCG